MPPWFKKFWSAHRQQQWGDPLRSDDWHKVKAALVRLRQANGLTEGLLRGLNLSGADWRGLDLTGVDLRGANLSAANLFRANLTGAKLVNAKLLGADLQGANLYHADLRLADLRTALLHRATLPDGMKWHSDINLAYFVDPLSRFYGEFPTYTISLHIPRELKQK